MCFPDIGRFTGKPPSDGSRTETGLRRGDLPEGVTTVGIDDTDSRELGMCTTYVADTIGRRLEERGAVDRLLLIRCNPAVEHKTRGNAALAIHTDVAVDTAFDIARDVVDDMAEAADDRTNPGVVVAPGDPNDVPDAVTAFAREAVVDHHTRSAARSVLDRGGYRHFGWKNGRGLIGALAAVGAWTALEEWTYEHIAYREPTRWGTERTVDSESVFDAADAFYPTVWDTVDRGTGETVCVPRTPGPVLYGVRGDDPEACRAVAERIDAEPIDRERTFVSNQGTDGHLRDGEIGSVRNGYSYRVDGTVVTAPETRRGGHVFFELRGDDATVECVAFEPTKRFRDRVRSLRVGDRLTVCGE